MVTGLDTFRSWFQDFQDEFVLIGGVAASLSMQQASLDFRSTKDLDIVLFVERLTADFGRQFWDFIEAGKYEIRTVGDTGKPIFYRFQKPGTPEFPVMVELFSRASQPITIAPSSQLVPIPFEDAISSLSAILLDDTYYHFLRDGYRLYDGIPHIGEDRLIPLKAAAWLDLTKRKDAGEQVDSKNIRKHANDVLRLSVLLPAKLGLTLPKVIAEDMSSFFDALQNGGTTNPKEFGLGNETLPEILARIKTAFDL